MFRVDLLVVAVVRQVVVVAHLVDAVPVEVLDNNIKKRTLYS